MRFGKQRQKCSENARQLVSVVGIGGRGGGRGDGSVMSVPDVKGDEDPVSESRQISFLCGKKKNREAFNYHF